MGDPAAAAGNAAEPGNLPNAGYGNPGSQLAGGGGKSAPNQPPTTGPAGYQSGSLGYGISYC